MVVMSLVKTAWRSVAVFVTSWLYHSFWLWPFILSVLVFMGTHFFFRCWVTSRFAHVYSNRVRGSDFILQMGQLNFWPCIKAKFKSNNKTTFLYWILTKIFTSRTIWFSSTFILLAESECEACAPCFTRS